MIKLTYTPRKPTFADASEPSPVQELTMTIGDGVSWDEVTREFHNFLRAAGYVIPYGLEWCEETYEYVKPGQEYYDKGTTDTVLGEPEVVKSFDQLERGREWVYLTEEEMLHIVTRDGMQLAEAIEAKLKEKNT